MIILIILAALYKEHSIMHVYPNANEYLYDVLLSYSKADLECFTICSTKIVRQIILRRPTQPKLAGHVSLSLFFLLCQDIVSANLHFILIRKDFSWFRERVICETPYAITFCVTYPCKISFQAD
jgi:hypothetical protein